MIPSLAEQAAAAAQRQAQLNEREAAAAAREAAAQQVEAACEAQHKRAAQAWAEAQQLRQQAEAERQAVLVRGGCWCYGLLPSVSASTCLPCLLTVSALIAHPHPHG